MVAEPSCWTPFWHDSRTILLHHIVTGWQDNPFVPHHNMTFLEYQITCNWTVYPTVCLANIKENPKPCVTVWSIHWWPVDSWYKWPIMRKAFPCHDVFILQDIHNSQQTQNVLMISLLHQMISHHHFDIIMTFCTPLWHNTWVNKLLWHKWITVKPLM